MIWTWLKATASSPSSSWASTGTASSCGGVSSSPSSSATRASSCPETSATLRAAAVSRCTGRTTECRISTDRVTQVAKISTASTSSRIACQPASAASESALAVICCASVDTVCWRMVASCAVTSLAASAALTPAFSLSSLASDCGSLCSMENSAVSWVCAEL